MEIGMVAERKTKVRPVCLAAEFIPSGLGNFPTRTAARETNKEKKEKKKKILT